MDHSKKRYCPWCQVKVSVRYSEREGVAKCHMCGYPIGNYSCPIVDEVMETE